MPQSGVVIVSGAGSGIGRASAQLLAASGWRLVLVGRTRSKLEQTAELIRRQGPVPDEPLLLAVDLCDPAAAGNLVKQTVDRLGRVDALANIAGSAPNLPIAQVTPAIWRDCIDSNLSYVVHLTVAAWPVFQRQQAGVVVNVSSLASIDPFEGFAIYAAAKAGLNLFTRVTADEGRAIGVRAVAIAPGCVETPMLRQIFPLEAVPADKALAPESVAQVIHDCILGRRDFAPGQVILVPSP